MELRDGKFYIDHDDKAARRHLAMQVNDNVYKNLKSFSPMLFDESQRYSKEQFGLDEKTLIVNKLIDKSVANQRELLHRSVDRVLLIHRNLKLVLFATTGPFFVMLTIFKYTIKALVLYYLYKG